MLLIPGDGTKRETGTLLPRGLNVGQVCTHTSFGFLAPRGLGLLKVEGFKGLQFRVWGLGFRVWGLGFRV